jgi:hypothetical protein
MYMYIYMKYNVICCFMHTLCNDQIRETSLFITLIFHHFLVVNTFKILSTSSFEVYSALLQIHSLYFALVHKSISFYLTVMVYPLTNFYLPLLSQLLVIDTLLLTSEINSFRLHIWARSCNNGLSVPGIFWWVAHIVANNKIPFFLMTG